MADTTTIQVSRETAESMRRLFPHLTYEEILRKLASGQALDLMSQLDSHTIPFRKTINPATWDEEKRRVGVLGSINAAYIHFPAGPTGLVEVRIVLETEGSERQIVPSVDRTYIALEDDTYQSAVLAIPVSPSDILRTEWYNYDGLNAHTVPAEVVIMKFAGRVQR